MEFANAFLVALAIPFKAAIVFQFVALKRQLSPDGIPLDYDPIICANTAPPRNRRGAAPLSSFLALSRKKRDVQGEKRESRTHSANLATTGVIDAATTLVNARRLGLCRLQFEIILLLCRFVGADAASSGGGPTSLRARHTSFAPPARLFA